MHRLQCHLKVLSPALTQGDPFALAPGDVLPQIHQINNLPAVSVPSSLTLGTVSVGSSYHIHYLTLYPQLLVLICHLSPLLIRILHPLLVFHIA